MKKEQISFYIILVLEGMIIGILIGLLIAECQFRKVGISQTSYCKEIQIDTIQYDYKQNMYKYQIKLIK